MIKTYTFIRVSHPRYPSVRIFDDKGLLYEWPLYGGWHVHLTVYLLSRILGDTLAAELSRAGSNRVTIPLNPKVFALRSPAVYASVRPSLWARITKFFNR